MRISPINNYTTSNSKINSTKQNENTPSFQGKFLVTKPIKYAVAGGIIGSLIGFFKDIRDALNQPIDETLPQSDFDVDLEIKTERDRIP